MSQPRPVCFVAAPWAPRLRAPSVLLRHISRSAPSRRPTWTLSSIPLDRTASSSSTDPTSTNSPDPDALPDLDDDAVVEDTDSAEARRRARAVVPDRSSTAVTAAAAAAAGWEGGAGGAGGGKARVPVSVTVEVGGRQVTFEAGRVARQAHGAVTLRDGDSVVYAFACAAHEASADVDFVPLRVDYFEKFSAVGRTAGNYLKREGRPSDREVLTSRLIDRPLRPMFAQGYFNEVQLLAYVFAYDGVHPSDWMGICASAAALHISHIPLIKAVAGVRVAQNPATGGFIVNPTTEQAEASRTDMVIAGTADAVLMIEGACDNLTEDKIVEAVALAQESIRDLCRAMDELRDKAGKDKLSSQLRIVPSELLASVKEKAVGLNDAVRVLSKKDREVAVDAVKDLVFAELGPTVQERMTDPAQADERTLYLKMAWKYVVSREMRRLITEQDLRPDGRDSKTVRPISIEAGILPTAHGSVLFTRGETQTLSVATLGGNENAQRYETLDETSGLKSFYLQYNFPPFSVGEVGRVGAPGRREIGHGHLAERALTAVLPDSNSFCYVIRVESNILESNGSSSMATVCGGCLAMLDAGVPLSSPVAGIAMGLILDRQTNKFSILTDLMGMEDALGDMDFKVAGTKTGITALQMDIKVEGITREIMREALEQARVGRLHVLAEMDKCIPDGKVELPDSVPKVRSFEIPLSSVGEIIGRGGESIKAIIEECGGDKNISINVGTEGVVTVSSRNLDLVDKAQKIIETRAVKPEVGTRYAGTVTKILPFGAYVEIMQGKEGWLHISEAELTRTEKMEDAISEGQEVEVEVSEVAKNGDFKLSRKSILLEQIGLAVGKRFTAPVIKVLPFGATLQLSPGVEGWLHVSEADVKRTPNMQKVCKEGDVLEVEVIEVGKRVRVSRKPILVIDLSNGAGTDSEEETEAEETVTTQS